MQHKYWTGRKRCQSADQAWLIAGAASGKSEMRFSCGPTPFGRPGLQHQQRQTNQHRRCRCHRSVPPPQHLYAFASASLCVSSFHRGHANLLCIVPMLPDDPRNPCGSAFLAAPRLRGGSESQPSKPVLWKVAGESRGGVENF